MSEEKTLKEVSVSGGSVWYDEEVSRLSDATDYLSALYEDEMDVFLYYAKNKGTAPFQDGYKHRFVLTYESTSGKYIVSYHS